MRVIYDFDATVETEGESYAVRAGGKDLPLNSKSMQVFFSEAVAAAGGYAAFEEQLRNDEFAMHNAKEKLDKITQLPMELAGALDMDEEEFTLLFLRILFNVNQRFVKRFLCDTYMFPESE